MRRIKVLVITNMYPDSKNVMFGIFVKNLVEELDKLGYVKQYIVANYIQKKNFLILMYKYISLSIKSIYYAALKDYDIIHAHFAYPTGLIAYICTFIKKKKLIISVHGSDINEVALRNKVNLKLCKFVLNRTDLLIANSGDIKRKIIRRFNINEDKIRVISIGVSTDLFKPMDKKICRMKLGLDLEEKIILFTGNIIKGKGVIHLVEAINLVKKKYRNDNIRCILLGVKLDSKYVNLIIRTIKILNLEGVVNLAGPVPYEKVPLWLNSSDIFILPSFSEGFGLAALEALACGVPTITANVGGLKEFIRDNETGYIIKPGDYESIADKIIYILKSNKEDISIIKENGFKIVRNLSTTNQMKKVEEVYYSLM